MFKFMLQKFIQSALLLVVLFTTVQSYAQVSQAPDGIQFQALATDANGHPAAGRVIYVKDAIIAKTATGTIVYSETFKVTASSAGIFTIVLGKGTYASGVSSIANIDWANGPFFLNLKIAVEPTVPTASWNVNNEYVDLGTSQFWSVPYALYAGSVKGLDTKLNIADTAAMLKPYFTAINLKANIESPTFTGTVSGITKAMVGLANVDNTSDLIKPISTATQAALDLKANTADVTTALALKANTADINTALALKANASDVTTALALKANTADVTTALNLKANTADVTTALALKANTADVTEALNLKANTTDVNTALALKANTADVTTALNLKANTTDVTTGLATKVDKVTGKELSTNDYTTAEKTKLAAITGTNTGDQDLSAFATNTALALKANTADVTTALNLKANVTDVTNSLATKVDKVTGKELSTNDYTTAEKTKLAAITGTNTGDQDLSALATNTALALKANTTDVTTALNLKANTTDVNNSLALKANVSSLSTVATSGSYNDLSNKPTIPSAYTLPTASASVLGGVKVGSNLSVDGNGVLSANINAGSISGTVTVANGGTGATTLTGLVKGNGTNALTAAVAGTDYQAPLTLATTGTGAATFSGTTLTIPTYSLPKADGTNLGGVKVGSNLSVDGNGVLSANINAGSISGTVTVANGGTGATTLTGLVKGNGTNALTAAVAGTDYQAPLTLTTTGTGAATFSGTTLTIPTYSLPIADGTNLGGVKVGSNLNVDANGVLTANINAGTLTGTTLAANVVNSSLTSIGTVTSGTISLTTDITTSGTLKAGAVTYPNIHGTNGQVLTTTGSGTLSWTSIPSPDLTNYVTTNTAQTITSAKTFSETTTFSKDLAVNGITVGRGGGNESTNTAIGINALSVNTPNTSNQNNLLGANNTATGADALKSNTTGAYNTAFGYSTLSTNITGSYSTAIGVDALKISTVGYNTALGPWALENNTTGANNVAVGISALSANTTGNNNTSIGNGANVGSGALTNATAIGNGASVTASNTIQLGDAAVTDVRTSGNLTVNGITVGKGKSTLINSSNTTNTAFGRETLSSNVSSGTITGTNNTSIGYQTLRDNTSGSFNTANGSNALKSNITGNSNTAIGYRTLSANTSGNDNTASGANALKSNTEGVYNTAYGSSTLLSNSTGSGNTAIGYFTLAFNTGNNNTANGNRALQDNTTGSNNTAIGTEAGRYIADGSTDNTTSDYSVYLGSNTKASADNAQNETVIGYNAIGAGSNTIQLGNTSVTNVKTSGTVSAGGFTTTGVILASGTVSAGGLLTWGDFYGTNIVASGKVTAASYITTSDLRLKSNIAPLANSLATVMQLNPVHYMKKGSLASTAYTREENGFIAQEIQKILPFVVTEGKDENKLLSVDYNSFIPVLTKAIQEQQRQIEDQNAKIAAQQKQIEELIKLMKEIKK